MFQSRSMHELSARLQHLIELRGIGLVTLDSGSGKSAACRKAASSLHKGLYKTLYVPLSTGNPIDLDPSECAPYLGHLLKRVGTELALFEPQALAALHQSSSGLPRKLNLLAHHALMAAAIQKSSVVTAEHVQLAMTECA